MRTGATSSHQVNRSFGAIPDQTRTASTDEQQGERLAGADVHRIAAESNRGRGLRGELAR